LSTKTDISIKQDEPRFSNDGDAVHRSSKQLLNGQPSGNGMGNNSNPKSDKEQRQTLAFHPLEPYKGMIRRFFLIYRHVLGLIMGAVVSTADALPKQRKKGLRSPGVRFWAFVTRPFIKKELRNLPFEQQLRRRLEMLGPTYVKLGQIMSIREDILPKEVTDELKNLLDRLPNVPYSEIESILKSELGESLDLYFDTIMETPLASASIAQTHRAVTKNGDRVVLKVIKPGIKDAILTDIRLLQMVSGFLEWLVPQYQPKMIINEFCAYTAKEVDLTYEADHAELFAANFEDVEGVVFPKIYRELSTEKVLCMEFLDGFKPGDRQVQELPQQVRETLVDYGAKAIIKMLYEDGFFHADLHPGNLMILPGPKVGFIDLGMVGRFDDKTRRYLLYYFYALVNGDVEGSARYLLNIATVGSGGDPKGFRRAVTDLFRRYSIYSARGEFSLGQLILESLRIGGKFNIFFPVEMTLMVKALVTYEGVGVMLDPNLDIPKVSRRHISKIYRQQYNPLELGQEFFRGGPQLVDTIIRLPQLFSDVARYIDEHLNENKNESPLDGLRSGIIAGSCIMGGVIGIIQDANIEIWLPLLIIGGGLALFGK
jgi:ubiquinone biosynthesis protein